MLAGLLLYPYLGLADVRRPAQLSDLTLNPHAAELAPAGVSTDIAL